MLSWTVLLKKNEHVHASKSEASSIKGSEKKRLPFRDPGAIPLLSQCFGRFLFGIVDTKSEGPQSTYINGNSPFYDEFRSFQNT